MKTWGDTLARQVDARIGGILANVAALAAIKAEEAEDGKLYLVDDGAGGSGSLWRFSASSTATDSTQQLVVVPTDGYAGAFLRADKFVDLKFAVDHTTADAAVLFTVPTGFRLRPTRPFWEVVDAFTGGASSAIGLSSSNASYNTKGDLLGGAGGDVAAGLTAGLKGTIGAKVASLGCVILVATNTIRFDRIVDNFTAGDGFAHIPVELVN